MTIEYILLKWQKEFSKMTDDQGNEIDNTTTPYLTKSVTNFVFLGIHDWIVSAFNIPVLTTEQFSQLNAGIPTSTVKQHDRKFIDKNTGQQKTVIVREFNKTTGLSVPDARRAILPHPTLTGASGKPNNVSIGFPSFFDVPMVAQALGQIIPSTKNPGFFKLEPTYSVYPIINNSTDGVLAGNTSGAWIVTSVGTPTNADETGQVTDQPKIMQPRQGRLF